LTATRPDGPAPTTNTRRLRGAIAAIVDVEMAAIVRRGFASATAPVRRQLLVYTYVSDMATKRGPVRPLHLVHAEAEVRTGRLLAGGAVGGADLREGLLVFAATPAEVEAFARADPYVTQGLVTQWRVAEWTVVVGKAPGEA
jgi:uncharacterized protein